MWFARLFGGRQDDSEPSEFAPHPAANTPKRALVTGSPLIPKEIASSDKKPRAAKGFDPYNSGSFDRNKAWERVIR